MNRKGFTLAEVLITLGIVGVIAALTWPMLINSYQKVVWDAQYKKGLNVVANAMQLAMAKNETPGDLLSTPLLNCYNTQDQMQAVSCMQENTKDLFAVNMDIYNQGFAEKLSNLMYDLTGEDSISMNDIFSQPAYAQLEVERFVPAWQRYSYFAFSTNDGMTFGYSEPIIDFNNYTDVLGAYMLIDVNGPKKPNILGKDLHYIGINKRGKVVDMNCELTYSCTDEQYKRLYDM